MRRRGRPRADRGSAEPLKESANAIPQWQRVVNDNREIELDCRGRHLWKTTGYDRQRTEISYRCARCQETKTERIKEA